jgi:antitoxin CptB
MTGLTLSSAELDPRRKRLLFRCWRRGTREMDLLLGGFAEHVLPTMSENDLAAFEHLASAPDREIYDWVAGKAPVPANYDSAVFRALAAHQAGLAR